MPPLWFVFSSKYINFSTPSALIIYLWRTSFVSPFFTHPPFRMFGTTLVLTVGGRTTWKSFRSARGERGRESREGCGNRGVLCSLKQFMHVMWETESDRKCLNVVLILKLVQIQMHKCSARPKIKQRSKETIQDEWNAASLRTYEEKN